MKLINRNKESLDESQDSNKKKFIEFVKGHDNELVLDYFDVVRLIGFAEDDEDYYYIVKNVKKGEMWVSCVGWLFPLKNVLPDEHYDRLESTFKLNEDLWEERIGE